MKKMNYQNDASWFRDDAATFGRDTVALPFFHDRAAPSAGVSLAAPTTPSPRGEISFLNGLTPDGRITDNSYWGSNGQTAFKWGNGALGTGATISYSFKGLDANEQQTVLKAFAMWSSVANVTFVAAANSQDADVIVKQGHFFSAFTSTPTSNGSGSTLGEVTGQAVINIDTRVPGFDLSGSFTKSGGYGLSTIVHETGHLLGLGHGGPYNGSVNPDTDQFSAYDERMYTTMSYISWQDGDTKYSDQNPNQGTFWDRSSAPHSVMALDILAIQQLYGAANNTPLDGGTTYGFNCNIAGLVHDFFDFTVNVAPVVTLFNEGGNNTLDLSGYSMEQTIDLHDAAFSSVGGLTNNICIAFGSRIETAIGGSGIDTITANDLGCEIFGKGGKDVVFGGAADDIFDGGGSKDILFGYAGQDTMAGGRGADTFAFASVSDSAKNADQADVITDFSHGEADKIDVSGIDAIAGGGDSAFRFIGSDDFGGRPGELRFEVVRGDALVSGDVDGNGVADFTIRVEDVTNLTSADFIL